MKNQKVIVFAGSHIDYFGDLYYCKDIDYVCCSLYPHYRRNVNGLLLSKKFLSFAPAWLIKRVYKKVFGWTCFDKIKKDDSVLCLFCSQFALYDDYIFPTFIDTLKRILPSTAKYVFYSYDLFGRHGIEAEGSHVLKSIFDMVLTFNFNDAKKYDLEYYGTVNSRVPSSKLVETQNSDLFYCGADAGRFDTQIKVFKFSSDLMLKNIFFIQGVSPEKVSDLPNLLKGAKKISDNTWSYKNSILHINLFLKYEVLVSYETRCKCIAEFLVGKSGATMRLPESVIYGKKLLTNNLLLIEHPSYNKNNMMIFDDPQRIDQNAFLDFINSPYQETDYDFSPLKMIDYIKEKLYK